MIDTPTFYHALLQKGWDTFFGVPDSLLKDLCAYITEHSLKDQHIITANEGNAVALATGHYLATGKPAVVYLQNSGLGNTINPLLSLADPAVYQIPMILMIGWRGEPGVSDEPQHITQGRLSEALLETLEMPYVLLEEDYEASLTQLHSLLEDRHAPVALLIRKNMFTSHNLPNVASPYPLSREAFLEAFIASIEPEALVVSTTGKTSRELFEIREALNHGHAQDFLTVGGMGHTSSIALGLALKTNRPVYCLDGDGSMLMHLGGVALVAQNMPNNLTYVVINNGAHESVGAQPTVAFHLKLPEMFQSFGFETVVTIEDASSIKDTLHALKPQLKKAIIVNVNTDSRKDLGRPTKTPKENKLDLRALLAKDHL